MQPLFLLGCPRRKGPAMGGCLAVARCQPDKYVYVLRFRTDRYRRAVADSRPGGTLADTHEGKPGLPRGRSRLPVRAVQASQRERLIRAVVAAVANGYAR